MKVYGLAKCSRLSDGRRINLPAVVELEENASTEDFVQAAEAFAAERGLSLIAWFPWSERQYVKHAAQYSATS